MQILVTNNHDDETVAYTFIKQDVSFLCHSSGIACVSVKRPVTECTMKELRAMGIIAQVCASKGGGTEAPPINILVEKLLHALDKDTYFRYKYGGSTKDLDDLWKEAIDVIELFS